MSKSVKYKRDSEKLRKQTSELRRELKKQDRRMSSIQKENDRHMQKLESTHNKEMKHLKDHYDRTIRILKQQHQQDLRKLNQGYEYSLRQVENEWKHKYDELMMKDSTKSDEEKAALKKQYEDSHKAQIEDMKAEFSKRQAMLVSEHNNKVRQLENNLASATDSLDDSNTAVEKEALEAASWRAKYTDKNKEFVELSSEHEDAKSELENAKAELIKVKEGHEKATEDLRTSLASSQDKLQHNAEVIDNLKHDISEMSNKISYLQSQLRENEKRVNMLNDERENLKTRAKKFELSSQDLSSELKKVDNLKDTYAQQVKENEENIQAYKDRIHQCELGMNQMRDDMEKEKRKHIELRQEYEDRSNKIQSLNSALEKYQHENASMQEMVEHVQQKYKELKSQSDRVLQHLKDLVEQRDTYENELAKEKAKSEKAREMLKVGRDEMNKQMEHIKNSEKHTYELLEDCQEKSKRVNELYDVQKDHVKQLESQIKSLMTEVGDDNSLKRKAQRLDEVVKVRDDELVSLKEKFQEVDKENIKLKQIIQEFEEHRKDDAKLIGRHRKLKTEHNETLDMLEDLKDEHARLQKKHSKIVDQMEDNSKNVESNERRLERYASAIKQLSAEKDELQDKIKKCLYPGEKEVMNKQLEDVIRQKEIIRDKFNDIADKNAKLVEELQKMDQQNKDLVVMREKYELDIKSLTKLAEESADLNNQLIKAKKLVAKKDDQLELLAAQLSTLINKVKVLEDRENMLNDKLKFSSSPEEMEDLNNKLIRCKSDAKTVQLKYQKLEEVADRLKEQGTLNSNKIKMLVDVLKDTEIAKEQLKTEQKVRKQLEEALKQCASDKEVVTKELKTRLQVMEQQYSDNLLQHEKVMSESKARISELQKDLETLLLNEKNARDRLAQQQFEYEESLRERAAMQQREQDRARVEEELKIKEEEEEQERLMQSKKKVLENRPQVSSKLTQQQLASNGNTLAPAVKEQLQKDKLREMEYRKVIKELQKQLAEVKAASKNSNEAAIKSTELKEMKQLAQIKALYRQALNEREKAIMQARSQTYNELISAISSASNNSPHAQDSLQTRLNEIRKRGSRREQEHLKDMLELRAVNVALAEEYRQARAEQWNMLQAAHKQSKSNLSNMVQQGASRENISSALTDHNRLQNARQTYVKHEQSDVLEDLNEQKRYLNQLQNDLLPKMKQTEAQINAENFPELSKFREQIEKEKNTTLGSIPVEDGHKTDHERSVSALEARLKAMQAEQNQMTESIKQYIKEPGPKARTDVVEAANQNSEKIMQNMKAAADLNDNRKTRVTFVVRPRTEEEVSKGEAIATSDQMSINKSKDQIQLNVGGRPVKYHADAVQVFPSPEETFVPTLSRVQKSLSAKRDLIVVTSAYEDPTKSGTSLKYIVFLNALNKIFPSIQKISPDGTVHLQFVQLTSAEKRYDLMANKPLPDGCVYTNCQATALPVTNVKEAIDIMNAIVNKIPTRKEGSNHLVLSITVPGNSATIHIVDVLYSSLPTLEIKLLDQSWMTYLAPTIEDNNSKLDLFYSVVPTGNQKAVEANNSHLQVSYRITKFLADYNALTGNA